MLSQFERLSLLNQYQLLAAADPRGGWNKNVAILQGGYSARYPEIFEALDPEMPEEDCRFVQDVLDMFDALQRPYVDSKSDVPDAFLFAGFDGNNEGAELRYTQFLRETEGRWSYVKVSGSDLNSHFPVKETYRRMMVEWQGQGSSHTLTKNQLDAVAKARTHPDNR